MPSYDICSTNQLIVFYIMATLAFNEVNYVMIIRPNWEMTTDPADQIILSHLRIPFISWNLIQTEFTNIFEYLPPSKVWFKVELANIKPFYQNMNQTIIIFNDTLTVESELNCPYLFTYPDKLSFGLLILICLSSNCPIHGGNPHVSRHFRAWSSTYPTFLEA